MTQHLTVDDVFRVHAEFGCLDHDMVKRGMGPNWPADWDERAAIFEPRTCFDCGDSGQCHMNCGPACSPTAKEPAMSYEGIMWGPSIRGYLADNKQRIKRCESSLASLKNQDGQYANDHRMLIALHREIGVVLARHIELADGTPLSRPERA